jgi:hypothetical protein
VKSVALARPGVLRPQVGLKLQESHQNAAKIFSVHEQGIEHVACRNRLLVDEVLTTGSIAGSYATALKKQVPPRLMFLPSPLSSNPSGHILRSERRK